MASIAGWAEIILFWLNLQNFIPNNILGENCVKCGVTFDNPILEPKGRFGDG